jgi:hypothetical protein
MDPEVRESVEAACARRFPARTKHAFDESEMTQTATGDDQDVPLPADGMR